MARENSHLTSGMVRSRKLSGLNALILMNSSF